MFGNYFYNRTIRRISVAFGSLFNDIQLKRFNPDGSEYQTIEVPLSYAPSHKWLARQNERSSIDNSVEGITDTRMIAPRMSYSLDNVVFDAERAMNRSNRMVLCDSDGRPVKWSGQRVPFNFTFTLSIYTKKTEDGLQILEQILPYFTPSLNIPVIDYPELGIQSDIPFELEDISQEDTYEGGFEEVRDIIWNLSFTARGWLYFAAQTVDRGIIEKVCMNYKPYCDFERTWETICIGAYPCDDEIVPEIVEVYAGQTQPINEFSIEEVLSAKYFILIEDPEGVQFRQMYQVLATHNGTTAYHTRYAQMGDSVLHDLNSVIEDGMLKLKVTNNQTTTLQIRIVRLDVCGEQE